MNVADLTGLLRNLAKRGILLGALAGTLLGATGALSWTVVAHTAALWHHGLNAESNDDGHPFLDSTDGSQRNASAAYQLCTGDRPHSPDGQYIHSHVHRYSDVWYVLMEAHIFSTQTNLSHHPHHPC